MPSYTKHIYEPNEAVSDTDYLIEEQEEAVREYARKHNYTVKSAFVNEAEINLEVM
jgi:hypothetical protein